MTYTIKGKCGKCKEGKENKDASRINVCKPLEEIKPAESKDGYGSNSPLKSQSLAGSESPIQQVQETRSAHDLDEAEQTAFMIKCQNCLYQNLNKIYCEVCNGTGQINPEISAVDIYKEMCNSTPKQAVEWLDKTFFPSSAVQEMVNNRIKELEKKSKQDLHMIAQLSNELDEKDNQIKKLEEDITHKEKLFKDFNSKLEIKYAEREQSLLASQGKITNLKRWV